MPSTDQDPRETGTNLKPKSKTVADGFSDPGLYFCKKKTELPCEKYWDDLNQKDIFR
jgi:hypothetical protein